MSDLKDFIKDLTPFLYGRAIVYMDLGAHFGETYFEFRKSLIKPTEAYLFEPSPSSLKRIKDELAKEESIKKLYLFQEAVSDFSGYVQMNERDDMTKVVSRNEVEETSLSEKHFQAKCTTIDDFVRDHDVESVSLLKIDIEGHELAALRGANQTLSLQKIDIIYVEAGFDPANRQQTYYRDIEDALSVHGYRVFRFYEQMHQWTVDSPLLRRINIAFMSEKFASNNPFRVNKELFLCREEKRKLIEKNLSLEKENATLKIFAGTSGNELTTQIERQYPSLSTNSTRENSGDEGNKELLDNLRVDSFNPNDEIHRQTSDIVALTSALEKRRVQFRELEIKSEQLKAQLKRNEIEMEEMTTSLKQSEAAYQQVLGSTSWRLTAPIRALKMAFRR